MQNNKENNFEKTPIDQKFYLISSKIKDVEGWKKYIENYCQLFCQIFAKLETECSNKNNDESNQKPIAVITGGQPGAGKSALIPTYKKLLKDNYNIDAIVNNADFYRFCIPGTDRIATDFPESVSLITDPVVKAMRKNLMEQSIAQGQSIIIENTLGDTIAVDLLRQSNIHEVWVALMAVPREESLLSDFERYIKLKEASDVSRLVSIEAHDKRYNALSKNAIRLENDGVRVIVHSRGETENDFAVVEYDSKDKNRKYANVIEAMNTIRQKSFKENVMGYGDRLKTIRQKMEDFGMTPDEEEELKKLEANINLSLSKNLVESRGI